MQMKGMETAAKYWMWTTTTRKLGAGAGGSLPLLGLPEMPPVSSSAMAAGGGAPAFQSWEERAFAEDSAAGRLGGCVWPPRSYTCSFCWREFRSAQALGGHMNVHRRDRARLKHPPSPAGDEEEEEEDQSQPSSFHNQQLNITEAAAAAAKNPNIGSGAFFLSPSLPSLILPSQTLITPIELPLTLGRDSKPSKRSYEDVGGGDGGRKRTRVDVGAGVEPVLSIFLKPAAKDDDEEEGSMLELHPSHSYSSCGGAATVELDLELRLGPGSSSSAAA